ncbi:ABC transporter substrate-binding protein [Labrys wisconsinensis]|uniref:Polar amino acid transport system substrate-binding protein n=1 Tax=Labrys wisconsinensis TaxID=425677 RepID=A0ABU0J4F5_9HYPH|nr:ABC transporter substrate-binding protein [Labrys wisconsinensis]MDQ0469114.1 polar amino acid transport system substrate-binding protein [Labrys wisconsinensis]
MNQPTASWSRFRAWSLAAAAAALTAGPIPAARAETITPPPAIAAAKKMVVCADIGSPPLSFYKEDGKLVGAEVDLSNAIAGRMGVGTEWRAVQFDGIIPALLAKQCDLIMSELYDKPKRREVVDFVDYLDSSQSLVVQKGNPAGIKGLDDLSGKKVAVENGTTIQSLVEEQNKKFASEGKPPAEAVVFPKDTDAFQALRIGQVQAYGTTIKTAGYYFTQAPDLFDLGGEPFAKAVIGAAFRKDDVELQKAFAAALAAIRQDGSYMTILKTWGIERDAL